EMSMTTQVKLLRVLQEGVVERLGGNKPIEVDVRIIAATNADLSNMVQEGRFREDLYYRLNVINVELPPLRWREQDVELLANFFLKKYNAKNSKNLEGFAPETLEAMDKYNWPGNVRELENAVERAVVLSKGPLIGVEALPQSVLVGRKRFDVVNITVGTTLREAERALIEATLASVDGDKETAANILGIASRTIYRKLP
nr:sigma 54-interacting transcriptional regulator [Candidatus Krumholzibacteria bacterium]